MEKFTFIDVLNSTGGKLYNVNNNITFNNIVIDNREVEENNLFVAIKGDRFDGHDYIEEAVKKGALGAITSRDIKNIPYCLVGDTRKALLDMAKFNRNRFDGTVIGVTGSVGKTTTKEMIASVLSTENRVLKTEGNLNNEIGLSKTLYGLSRDFDCAVIEMGMSNLGEIKKLSDATKPDISVITNIGYSHIENLLTRDNILKAKLEILEGAKKNSPIIVNSDNDMLKDLHFSDRQVIKCAIEDKNANYRAINIKNIEGGVSFDIESRDGIYKINLNVLGNHNIYNALISFAIGKLLKVNNNKIIEGIGNFKPAGFRQNIKEKAGVKYIIDCYNASPDSMKASLETLKDIKTNGKKIAIIGDMLELGDYAEKSHIDLAKEVDKSGVSVLFCTGENSKLIIKNTKSVKVKKHFTDKQELKRSLFNIINSGDIVLLKASRGIKLETIVMDLFKD